MFVVSVEIEIEDAIELRKYLESEEPIDSWSPISEALTESICSGADEMREVGMEVPRGV